MDLRQYFMDLRAIEAELEGSKTRDGVVYVTSIFHREKNSTAGSTLSASCRNAARVITDGTHRVATPQEVENFMEMQAIALEETIKAEQLKKKQYIVVVDQKQPSETGALGGNPFRLTGNEGGGRTAGKTGDKTD